MKQLRDTFQMDSLYLIPLLISPFFVPFLLFPIDATYLTELSAAFISLTFWIISIKRIQIPVGAILLFGLLMLGQLGIYLFGGIVNVDTWNIGIFMLLSAFALFIAAGSSKKEHIVHLSNLYVLAVLLWGFSGLYGWLSDPAKLPVLLGPFALAFENSGKLSGPFAQGNIFAGMVGAAWVIVLWKILFRNSNEFLVFSLLLLLTILSTCTMSKGAWLAQFGVAGVFLFAAYRKAERNTFASTPSSKSLKLLTVLIVAAFIGNHLVELHTEIVSAKTSPMDRFFTQAENSANSRFTIWTTSLLMFIDQPLFGVGLGNYANHYFTYQPSALDMLQQSNISASGSWGGASAHNIVLQLISEGGVPGGVFIIAVVILTLFSLKRYLRRPEDPRFIAGASALLLLLQGMLNVTLIKPMPLFFFAIFLGFAAAPIMFHTGHNTMSIPSRRNKVLIALVISISAALILSSYNSTIKWQRFEQLFYSDNIYQAESLREIDRLLQDSRVKSTLAPYLAKRIILEQEHLQLLSAIKPHLVHAQTILPMYDGFQLLFYLSLLEKNWEQACEVGKFIKSQRYRSDRNIDAYDNACIEISPKVFYFKSK